MKMFDVTASRSQGWWAIHANVPGVSVWTQARRLDQVEATAREAISLALDTAQDSFELSIAPVVPEGIRHEVELARNTARLAAIAQAIATTLNQHAAVSLTAEGYTVRDAGYLMNLSSQRISQLVAQQRNRAEESTEASTTFESVVESLLAQLLSAAEDSLTPPARRARRVSARSRFGDGRQRRSDVRRARCERLQRMAP